MNALRLLVLLLVVFACSDEMPSELPVEFNVPPYGVDGLNLQYLDEIALLNDGVSGINGISWQDLEPAAPVNGIHNYQLGSNFSTLKQALEGTGRKLQLNFRLSSNWALERDPNNQITNPGDGSREDGILRVKSEYEDDLAEVIQYILENIEVESLQIGSEAENEWLNADEFVKAMSIIYKAAKEVQPDLVIMAFGFNPANYFSQPELFPKELIESKIDFAGKVLQIGASWFDVFSFHASREYEAIEPTVAWIKDFMQKNGYQKPIWIDDMYSAPWLHPVTGTEAEKILYNGLLNESPTAIALFDSLQASYMIKKISVAFASGVEKIFVSTDVDWDFYYIPNWRFVGLINRNGNFKPAYYNLQLLIEKTNDFEEVVDLGNHLYKFTFKDKKAVYIYWNENSGANRALSGIHADSFRVHEFTYKMGEMPTSTAVTNLDGYSVGGNPILIEIN